MCHDRHELSASALAGAPPDGVARSLRSEGRATSPDPTDDRAALRWPRSTAPVSSWWGRWRTLRPSGAVSTTAKAESGRREIDARDHSSAATGETASARTTHRIAGLIFMSEYPRAANRDNAQRVIRRR